MSALNPQQVQLIKLARMKMPFGKYKDCLLCDLPEHYLVWFSREGFPPGELGEMMAILYELKLNGLEYLLKPLKEKN